MCINNCCTSCKCQKPVQIPDPKPGEIWDFYYGGTAKIISVEDNCVFYIYSITRDGATATECGARKIEVFRRDYKPKPADPIERWGVFDLETKNIQNYCNSKEAAQRVVINSSSDYRPASRFKIVHLKEVTD